MLKIPIILVPFGIEDKARVLSHIEIINTGRYKDPSEFGNYEGKLVDTEGNIIKICKIRKYKREMGYLPLLEKVVKKLNRVEMNEYKSN